MPGGASQTFVNMMDGLKNSGKSNFAYDSMSHIVGVSLFIQPLQLDFLKLM